MATRTAIRHKPQRSTAPAESPDVRRKRQRDERLRAERQEHERRERDEDERRQRDRSEQRERKPPRRDLLWGAQEIADYLDRPLRQVRYLISINKLPIKRLGRKTIVALKTEIDRALSAEGAGHAA